MSATLKETIKLEADAVIVGTGPGGATVGRELALAGKKVIFIEGADVELTIPDNFLTDGVSFETDRNQDETLKLLGGPSQVFPGRDERAGQVDLHRGFPQVQRHVLDAAGRGDGGVVDEDFDRA